MKRERERERELSCLIESSDDKALCSICIDCGGTAHRSMEEGEIERDTAG